MILKSSALYFLRLPERSSQPHSRQTKRCRCPYASRAFFRLASSEQARNKASSMAFRSGWEQTVQLRGMVFYLSADSVLLCILSGDEGKLRDLLKSVEGAEDIKWRIKGEE